MPRNKPLSGSTITSPGLESSTTSIRTSITATCGFQVVPEFPVLQAALNSSSHLPSPACQWHPCHPGTRQNFLEKLKQWSTSDTLRAKRIFWVSGPPGVGKSALARSYIATLGPRLGASFCFDRINHTSHLSLFFPSISYQLAQRNKFYADALDTQIQREPGIAEMPMQQQFHILFVLPLRAVSQEGSALDELVIVVDGLEESAPDTAQETLIRIIAQSAREGITPFRWLIFSRPEPLLLVTFDIPSIHSITLHLEMSATRDLDHEFRLFLTDELDTVGRKHNLPQSWPRMQDIQTLVDFSSGQFIFPSAAIQFINQPGAYGPEESLRTILRMPNSLVQSSSELPFSRLHHIYRLVMQRAPADLLFPAQRVLLTGCLRMSNIGVERLLSFLDMSESQFRSICEALSPFMMHVTERGSISFFHSSFLDFLCDAASSEELCILGGPAIAMRAELLQRLNAIHSVNLNSYEDDQKLAMVWPLYTKPERRITAYQDLVNGFFKLLYLLPLETASALADFDFNKLCLFGELKLDFDGMSPLALDNIIEKMPEYIRNKSVEPIRDRNPLPYAIDRTCTPSLAQPAYSYILGRGEKRAFLWCSHDSYSYTIISYPNHRRRKLLQILSGPVHCRRKQRN